MNTAEKAGYRGNGKFFLLLTTKAFDFPAVLRPLCGAPR
jgi:hypothetical protein